MPETELVYVLAKGAHIIWQSQSLVFNSCMCLLLRKLFYNNKKVMKEVINYFKSQQEAAFEKMNKCSRTAAIAPVAAHRHIAKALHIRKQYVWLLIKTVKHVCGIHIKGQCDFGEGLHSVRSEHYHYESIYYFEHKPSVFVVDSCRRCCQDIEVHNDSTSMEVF